MHIIAQIKSLVSLNTVFFVPSSDETWQ